MVGEAVTDETQATFFDVLFDGVQELFLADFHLGVGPTGNLDDHVEDAILLVCEKRNVVPEGSHLAVALDEDSMI